MTKTILLVDDESYSRELLGRFIERKGLAVLRAANGAQAINLCKANKPDCVFLDVKLPDIDGIAVLEKIKEINPNMKVYFVTGIDDASFKEKAKELGAEGCLIKPIILDDILEIIRAI